MTEATEGAQPAPGSTGRRAIWTFADQGLSSLTNASLAIVVAKSVDQDKFGAFALGLLTYSFVVGLSRSLVGEPFMVRYSAVAPGLRHAAMRRAGGAALSVGLAAGLVCAVVAALGSGSLRGAFAALAICLPGLCVQDNWRHMFFAAGQPREATVNDLLWTVLQFGGLTAVLLAGSRDVFTITLVWGLSANAAALFGVVQTRVVPAIGATAHWLREMADLNRQMAAGYVINSGAVQVGTYAVTGFVGLVGASALRGAQTLLGPLNLLFSGFNAFFLPLLVRRIAAGKSLRSYALMGSSGLALVATTWTGLLLLLPQAAGQQILGDSWDVAHDAMLPSGLVLIAGALVLGASNSLVALSRPDLTLRITFVQAPLMLVLGVGGAWLGGFLGAAYGFAIAQSVGLVLCWLAFLRAETARGVPA